MLPTGPVLLLMGTSLLKVNVKELVSFSLNAFADQWPISDQLLKHLYAVSLVAGVDFFCFLLHFLHF